MGPQVCWALACPALHALFTRPTCLGPLPLLAPPTQGLGNRRPLVSPKLFPPLLTLDTGWLPVRAAVTGTFWATWLTQGEVQLLRSGPRGFQSPRAGRHWNEAIPVETDKKVKGEETKRGQGRRETTEQRMRRRGTLGKRHKAARPSLAELEPPRQDPRWKVFSTKPLSTLPGTPRAPGLLISPTSVLALLL